MASCAVPGLLPPVEIDGRHYFDGGLVHSIPVGRAIALGASTVYVLHVGRIESQLPVPTRPWEVGLVAFEIARRHRFHEEMAAIPPGVRVHVLPSGGDQPQPGLGQFRYRSKNKVSNSIDRAYAASASYLAQQGAARCHRPQETPMLPPRLIRRLLLAPLVVVIAAPGRPDTAGRPPQRDLQPGQAVDRAAAPVSAAAGGVSGAHLVVGEMAALTVLLGLWIASGFGGRLDAEPYRARHYAVMGGSST